MESTDAATIATAVEDSLRAIIAKEKARREAEKTAKAEKAARKAAGIQHESDTESDSEPDEASLPPGPIDPQRCAVTGPGFSGGAAGAAIKLVVTAKDSTGKRIREGGAEVAVFLEPGDRSAHQERIDAEVTDHKDGTYTAVYTVPIKGSYKVGGGGWVVVG